VGGRADRDLRDIRFIDIDFNPHIIGVRELDDVGGAAPRLNLAAVIYRIIPKAMRLPSVP
jgi:hypothetical protein